MHANSPRIGIFGGSFDPPHLGHVSGARWALESGEIERVIAIPVGIHAFGKLAGAPFAHRVAMTRIAFHDMTQVSVDEREGRRSGTTYTIDTLYELTSENPGASFRLIAGSDVRAEVAKWRSGDVVLRMAPLLELPRMDAGPLPKVSSTDIRHILRDGGDTSALVPAAVREYIDANGLYR